MNLPLIGSSSIRRHLDVLLVMLTQLEASGVKSKTGDNLFVSISVMSKQACLYSFFGGKCTRTPTI